jgi:hypothetical protein
VVADRVGFEPAMGLQFEKPGFAFAAASMGWMPVGFVAVAAAAAEVAVRRSVRRGCCSTSAWA